MGLGPFPDIALADARAKATALRQQRHSGTDPLEARRARRAQARIESARGQVAEEFIARNEAGWHNQKHRAQWRNTLTTYVYPTLA